MGKCKPGYYAVLVGRKKGIYQTWEECKTQVCKFPNARFMRLIPENVKFGQMVVHLIMVQKMLEQVLEYIGVIKI